MPGYTAALGGPELPERGRAVPLRNQGRNCPDSAMGTAPGPVCVDMGPWAAHPKGDRPAGEVARGEGDAGRGYRGWVLLASPSWTPRLAECAPLQESADLREHQGWVQSRAEQGMKRSPALSHVGAERAS